jgi:tetratricopeptide (TPR) repeat protein/DNA-binding SARP family transcriptional activator
MEPKFGILGQTRLRIGDRFDDNWGSPKLRGILAVLLLHPRQPISTDTLIDWVWRDGDGPRERATFYTYSKRIRGALEQMAEPPELTAGGGAYRIDAQREEIDVFQFRTLLAQARSMISLGDHEPAIRQLESALELWSGIPLADLQGGPANTWRHWAREQVHLPAHETMLQALSQLGRYEEVLYRVADLPVGYQSNLSLIKLRLEALRGAGRSKEATTYYLDRRKRFTAEFDHDEADELKRFNDELVNREPTRPATAVDLERPAQAPHMLPHDVRDFTGRENHLRQLDAMATSITGDLISGVVVVDGPPGIGKTSLAVHWAHRIAERFPSGRLYADLAGFAGGAKVEPSEVVDAFLTALGFAVDRIPSAAARAAKLRNLLAGRRVLVILDNAHSSEHVAPLLDCLPTCLIVVTSRRRLTGLGRRGAVSLSVPRLDYSDAKRWLSKRIGERAADDPDAVAELTAMCDGNPLALRGVSDHVVSRPRVRLGEFVDELRDTQVLLGLGDDGDGPDGSVRAVFSWSYHALPARERQLFRLLGLHAGQDISLDAAAALACRDRASTKRDLDVLVSAHLLTQPESRNRYRFHDLIRRYANECATGFEYRNERAPAELRLLSFYLHTANNADRVVFSQQRGIETDAIVDGVVPMRFDSLDDAMNWCLRERTNLLATIRYAQQLGHHTHVFRLASVAGEILLRLGYYDDLVAVLRMAVTSARALGDDKSESFSLGNLGVLNIQLRDFDSAESHLLAEDAKSQAIGYVLGSAHARHHLGRLYVEKGEFDRALGLYREVLELTKRADGANDMEVRTVYRLGEAYRRANNLHAAMSFCRDGLWLAEQVNHELAQGLILTELAMSYYEYGDLASAKGYAERAMAIHQRLRNSEQIGKTYNALCMIHRDEGNRAQAQRCAREALRHCRIARDFRGQAIAYERLGQLLHADAQLDEAAQAWSKALTLLDDLGDPLAASVRARLAEVAELPPPVPVTRTEPLIQDRQFWVG